MPSFSDLVSFGDGVASVSLVSLGENIRASSLADRPPGNDCTFSFCPSMMSKLTRSSEGAIFGDAVGCGKYSRQYEPDKPIPGFRWRLKLLYGQWCPRVVAVSVTRKTPEKAVMVYR